MRYPRNRVPHWWLPNFASFQREKRMLKSFIFALGLCTFAGSSLVASVPAGAADDAMMKMDCSKAGSMMSDASKMGSSAAMTGDQDKDFMVIMMDHEKGTAMLFKVEAACGKDPKMKAMAAKEETNSEARMQMFRNQNSSQ
jgi:hypothetical protein